MQMFVRSLKELWFWSIAEECRKSQHLLRALVFSGDKQQNHLSVIKKELKKLCHTPVLMFPTGILLIACEIKKKNAFAQLDTPFITLEDAASRKPFAS